jgi:hypothetical protein
MARTTFESTGPAQGGAAGSEVVPTLLRKNEIDSVSSARPTSLEGGVLGLLRHDPPADRAVGRR